MSKFKKGAGAGLKFVDKVRIYARGGRGGQGSSVVGSAGGEGGDVTVCAVNGSNLRDFARKETRRFVADLGGAGERSRACGRKGAGIDLSVPPGTCVYDDKEKLVCDLDECGRKHLLVKGGRGGNSNTPNWHGSPGQRGVFVLKLKTVADVGLVGQVNPIECTIQSDPEVDSYPFTTLHPQVGILHGSSDDGVLSLADLPGLVEGAHRNVGRGHKFLQHIERTRALLYVVDITGFQLSSRHPVLDPYSAIEVLVKELELYHPGLAHNRKAILAVNKMDTLHALKRLQQLLGALERKSPVQFHAIVGCSAVEKTGTQAIKNALLNLY